MNTTEKVANTISGWYDNYASTYDFDAAIQFEDFSLEEMKEVDVEKVWELVSPKLKQLVSDYVLSGIEDKQ